MFLSHSVKCSWSSPRGRVRYLDDIGRARRLVLEADPGTHEFLVIVQPQGELGVSVGAPSDPERRRRPNATVLVEADKITTVKVGAFTDFVRDFDRNPNGRSGTDPVQHAEGSHFVTRIDVGEPRERRR